VGLVFRGSGFYTTDYRRPKDGSSRAEEKKSESDRKSDTKDTSTKEGKSSGT
jgi:predicted nucleic acid-binding Zn ribbon protein